MIQTRANPYANFMAYPVVLLSDRIIRYFNNLQHYKKRKRYFTPLWLTEPKTIITNAYISNLHEKTCDTIMTPYYTFLSLLSDCTGNWQIERVSNNTRVEVTQFVKKIQGRHNERDGVSNHRRLHCLLNRLFGEDQRKHQISASLAFFAGIQRWLVTPLTKVSNAENVSIWWHHHGSAYSWTTNHKLLLELIGTPWQEAVQDILLIIFFSDLFRKRYIFVYSIFFDICMDYNVYWFVTQKGQNNRVYHKLYSGLYVLILFKLLVSLKRVYFSVWNIIYKDAADNSIGNWST